MLCYPPQQLLFNYQAKKHLQTTLRLENPTKTGLKFKFKVSNHKNFFIEPKEGILAAGSVVDVSVSIHRDVAVNLMQMVDTVAEEKFRLIYGADETKDFKLCVVGGSNQDQLNLTMMVNQKTNAVKLLEKDVNLYKTMPGRSTSVKEANTKITTYVFILLLGLIIGYLIPIRLFKRGW